MKQILIFFILSFVLISSNAFAGTKEEVQQLQSEVANLKQTYSNNFGQVAKAMSELSEIRTELQQIKGNMETAGWNKVEKDNTYKELETRILSVENKLSQLHTLFSSFKKTSEQETTGTPTAKSEFNQMLMLMGEENYHAAISGLQGFIQKYPSSPYTAEAQYWISEAYFSINDYNKAIAEFQKFVEANPSSPMTSVAIYRQGVSFLNLKSYPESKLFFEKVISNFPRSKEAFDARKRISRISQLLEAQNPQQNNS